jgi:hypothetical protein
MEGSRFPFRQTLVIIVIGDMRVTTLAQLHAFLNILSGDLLVDKHDRTS